MKKVSAWKMTLRSIRSFFGRYMAILLIVALSVGFFAGFKVTKQAMSATAEDYFRKTQLYDYRLLSTVGFSLTDPAKVAERDEIAKAEGGKSLDLLIDRGDRVSAFKLIAMPSLVNLPSLVAGRMPEKAGECLADKKAFSKEDIGKTLRVDAQNDSAQTALLAGEEYTIVGLADSPLYLGLDRGTTSIGDGSLSGFLYILPENFLMNYYTEIAVTLRDTAPAYSEAYDGQVEDDRESIEILTQTLAKKRCRELMQDKGIPGVLPALMQYPGLQVYVLGRTENAGYVSFRNDTSIVSGIANIFPVFFILIALLVCITTMTRMVAEERTQIGTLKALGVRGIAVKYLLYAGSATAIGWGVGFFAGTFFLPKVFWYAYHSLYSFAPIRFVFSLPLALLTGLASLLGILAAAFFCCHGTLTEVPARLLRPKGLKSGRRILLEHIAPLWRRFSFLTKVMLRNLFRYKQRFVMMLCGIACCAALVVAAFGVRDSMLGIAAWHYDTVQTYGVSASFDSAEKDAVTAFAQTASGVLGYTTCLEERVELHREGQTLSSVYLFAFADPADAEGYFSFHQGDRQLPFPGQGEALLSTQAAEKLGVREGDSLTVWDSANKEMTVTVCGIYDNYIEHYLIVGAQTYADAYGAYAQNTLLLRTEGDTQPIAEALTALSAVRSVTQLPVIRGRVDSALFCLNYVIWLVVAFSFALAFIVIFNLTNINLAERSREVATVEVLGFTPRETQRYVLHENILLSFFAAILGMPLGTLLHRAVMQMIVIDSVCFGRSIRWQSYLLGFVCTLCFAFLVNLFMRRQIRKIKMAESLKAVE